MPQDLRVAIKQRGVGGRIDDLQDELVALGRAQIKIAVALAGKRPNLGRQAV